jgi:hypothetical protein
VLLDDRRESRLQRRQRFDAAGYGRGGADHQAMLAA